MIFIGSLPMSYAIKIAFFFMRRFSKSNHELGINKYGLLNKAN